nr:MAG TPA: hypothetical protein [Caudoviricetes sp.]
MATLSAATFRVSMSFPIFGQYHNNTLLCILSGDVLGILYFL